MTVPKMNLFCRTATTFSSTQALDENAMRGFLQRFVDARVGVSLASGVTGECHALSSDELRRVYEIGVEVCKGKVPVHASLPGVPTAQTTIANARIAIAAGIEVVNFYGPAAHGFRPTDVELTTYFDEVLGAIQHPVAIAPNPVMGYTPSPAVTADICNRHPQVVIVNLSGLGEPYFLALRELIKREVEIYVAIPGSMHMLGLGAAGLIDAHANLIPKTHRRYLDLYESRDYDALNGAYAELRRYSRYVAQWGSVKSIKMAMKAFRLPGGDGGARRPFVMPPDDEAEKFVRGLLQLHLAEIDELARAAGIPV